MADLARGAQPGANCAMTSKCEAVPQILTLRHDAADQRALVFGFDQRSDQVELVHGNELENLAAHLA